MLHDDRSWSVIRILTDYLKSPSLRHLRDPHSLGKVAREIVKYFERRGAAWGKWERERESWAQKALPCWIPMEDLCDFLNRMPGPPLTTTDVAARLDAMEHEESIANRIEALRDGCLAIYQREEAAGTEMPAIIWAIDQYVVREEERYFVEREENRKRQATWCPSR